MSDSTPVRAVIFDIGNVILRFDFSIALKKIAALCTPEPAVILQVMEPAKVAYEGGRLSRADFFSEMRRLTAYRGTDAEFISAWEDIFTENEPVRDLVGKLHGRVPLYLLSNTNDMHLDYIHKCYPVFGCFTDAVYSHVAGAAKPEPEIFEIAARQFGLKPAEAIFIDDLLPNIEAAQRAGFRTHHYHHERHEALLQDLQRAGLAI